MDDYAVLLRACLPAAVGLCCQAGDGEVLFASLPAGVPPPAIRPSAGQRSAVGDWHIDTFALDGGPAPSPGTVSVWTARSSGADPVTVAAGVDPVLRVLGRELALRLRLLEGHRRLDVQATEERLLHAVEHLAHRDDEALGLLTAILTRCCRELPVVGAALLVPGLGIELAEGDAATIAGASRALAALTRDPAPPPDAGCPGGDHCAVGIRRGGGPVVGVLLLAGFAECAFSERRRARVARYVASQVELLLDRDFDRLTGLAVEPRFAAGLALAGDEADPCRHTALYLDVDQLHVVNEAFGPATGDELLTRLAAILREILPGQLVARLDGDHFAALLRDTRVAAARSLATRVVARLAEVEFQAGEQAHRPSVSIGVASLPARATSAPAYLAPAQVACQAAKDRGGGRVEVYASADESIVRRLDDIQLVGYLRSAIDRGRLLLLAQPIIPTRPGPRRPYFEMLVRLVDDHGGQVSPSEFISAAERYRLMEELDRWVVSEALRFAATIPAGCVAPRLAINLSGHSLGSEAFPAFVQERIAQSGVAPDLLCFEITESVAVANMQRAQALMHGLRRIGCHLSLDDFGTGLSSFAYLKLFPVDTLKIDGSFVRDVTRNVVSQSVVAAISEVARVMQLETVAEYVQDEETLALVARLGITWAQGYHTGEPAPLASCLAALPAATAAPPLSVQRSPGRRPAR